MLSSNYKTKFLLQINQVGMFGALFSMLQLLLNASRLILYKFSEINTDICDEAQSKWQKGLCPTNQMSLGHIHLLSPQIRAKLTLNVYTLILYNIDKEWQNYKREATNSLHFINAFKSFSSLVHSKCP